MLPGVTWWNYSWLGAITYVGIMVLRRYMLTSLWNYAEKGVMGSCRFQKGAHGCIKKNWIVDSIMATLSFLFKLLNGCIFQKPPPCFWRLPIEPIKHAE